MIEKNIKYLLLIVSLVLSSFSFAQDVKFSAATSHTEVNTGDRFQIHALLFKHARELLA